MRDEWGVGAAAQRRGMMDAKRKTEEIMVTVCVGPRIVVAIMFSKCDLSRGEKCISK